jgi:FkbM family methyltransferase
MNAEHSSQTKFDSDDYLRLIESRGAVIRRVLSDLQGAISLSTALDAGCGLGFFAEILREAGLAVRAFDGRSENIEEARKRFPGILFESGDIENPGIRALGPSDFVLCFGLLYHVENPLLAIRNLRALTGKCLFLESMCFPSGEPWMLLREEPNQEDQSLTDLAFYPTEGCIVKMLYRAGFAAVYRLAQLPDHDQFRETSDHVRRRTILLASFSPINLASLILLSEPAESRYPWAKRNSDRPSLPRRAWRFLLHQSARAKYATLVRRFHRMFPSVPVPLRLTFGAWWLVRNSALDEELLNNSFEPAELNLVSRLLRPGMTVLDVGAHHGLYSLLMAKRIGQTGKLVAFEPSSRERMRLLRHLQINRFSNVRVEPYALGSETSEAELFLLDGIHDWGNSLKPPSLGPSSRTERVQVRRLDDVLSDLGITHVDFIKLDVEGAELSFLKGASETLSRTPRPAILAEVQDVRTRPWGYSAREIIRWLVQMKYEWFELSASGSLLPAPVEQQSYDSNLVALPSERIEEFQRLLAKSEI